MVNRAHRVLLPPRPKIRLGQEAQHSQQKMGGVGMPITVIQLYSHRSELHCKPLAHWGRMTHICVGNLATIGSENGLYPGRRQAIIYTNAKILLIGPLWTHFREILIKIRTISFKESFLSVVCEMAVILSRPQCVNVRGTKPLLNESISGFLMHWLLMCWDARTSAPWLLCMIGRPLPSIEK